MIGPELFLLLLGGVALFSYGLSGADDDGGIGADDEDPQPLDPGNGAVALGSDGADLIELNENNLVLQALGGDDDIEIGPQTAFVSGGDDDDSIDGGANPHAGFLESLALLAGGEGADTITGTDGDDFLFAAGPDSAIEALGGLFDGDGLAAFADVDEDVDVLDGQDGDDILFFSHGDSATGGEGFDQFLFFTDGSSDADPAVIEDYEAGETITVVLDLGQDSLIGGPTIEVISDTQAIVTTTFFDGEQTSLIINGDIGENGDNIDIEIEGIIDDDAVDFLALTQGDDELDAENEAGSVVVDGFGGDDVINVTAAEALVMGGAGDDEVSVTTTDEETGIDAFDEAAIVVGGDGADTLTGTESDDILSGNGPNVADELVLAPFNLLLAESEEDFDAAINETLELLTASDGAADIVDGGAGDDTLMGSADDTLSGGEGVDEYQVHDVEAIIETGAPLIISNFDSDEVIKLLFREDFDGELTVEDDLTTPDAATISVNGTVVVVIQNGAVPNIDDIVLEAFSFAKLDELTFGDIGGFVTA